MSAPLRIAYVINSLEGGGAASPVPAIVGVLRAAGAEVRLLALTPRDRLGLPAIAAAGIDWRLRSGGRDDHLAAWRWLDRQIADFAPDLIWTSLTRATLLGQLVGMRRRLAVVSWQHQAFLKPINLRLLRAMQRRSILWVADSDSVAILTAARLGIEPQRLMSWPIFAADPAAPIATPWQPGQPLHLGTLGRLHPNKGYDLLVGAMARLKAEGFVPPAPIDLVIAGSGDQRSRLEAMIAAAGLDDIRLPGFAPSPRTFLAGLHLYLQPSRAEGFCIAAHEAMQAGLPVIGSDVGEMPHSITPASGLIVAPGDVASLANAIAAMVSRPGQLATMGRAARERTLDRFSADRFAASGRAVLGRAVELCRARRAADR